MGGTAAKRAGRAAARLAATGAMAAAGLVALAPAASASWLEPSYPRPAGATTWAFNAVSCAAARACAAVGSDNTSSGTHLVAERLSSSGAWVIQSAPEPSAASASEFLGVSCPSQTACAAVGDSTGASGTVTLAETWNGSGWTLWSTPNPGGAASSSLTAVSCASATACMAVGTASSGPSATSAFAEVWNGSGWVSKPVPAPGGASATTLDGVSCTSASRCSAVGSVRAGASAEPLIELWNGAKWSVQPAPHPSGTDNPLYAVSCSSATACTAVGEAFAERWNGAKWALQTIAEPKGNTPAQLTGVSCASSTACSAVGAFFDKEAIQMLVAEAWTGSAWKVQSVPVTSSYDSSGLNAISCVNATTCVAAGTYHDPVDGDQGLLESAALRWQPIVPGPPAGAIASSLDSLSCTAPKFCMGVGDYEGNGSVFGAYADTWNGSAWFALTTPDSTSSSLSGVACSSPAACTAVGDVFSGGGLLTLALRWNGSTWAVQHTPNPAGAVRSYLISVSCPGAAACAAVGEYVTSTGKRRTLAESWNGATWKLQTTLNPSGATTSELNGVSCASASACMAVGDSVASVSAALAERWNGAKWSITSVPLPPGGSDGFLGGVSCPAASACVAVGSVLSGGHSVPLAERWNGTSWKEQPIPAPAKATASVLRGVSCFSATVCAGVGSVLRAASNSLAEYWSGGKWAVQSAPPPFGAQSSDLESVSCPSLVECMGIGYYDDNSGSEGPLAEQYS